MFYADQRDQNGPNGFDDSHFVIEKGFLCFNLQRIFYGLNKFKKNIFCCGHVITPPPLPVSFDRSRLIFIDAFPEEHTVELFYS